MTAGAEGIQQTLLADLTTSPPVPVIAGLHLHRGVLTPSTEQALIRHADTAAWRQVWQRRTQVYGRAYRDSRHGGGPMPDWLQTLGSTLAAHSLLPATPDQAGLNEYLPGQGISQHSDKDDGSRWVGILSLGSHCLFDLECGDDQRHSIHLEPGSLLILSQASFTDWTHGMAPRQADRINGILVPRGRRISVTFRSS